MERGCQHPSQAAKNMMNSCNIVSITGSLRDTYYFLRSGDGCGGCFAGCRSIGFCPGSSLGLSTGIAFRAFSMPHAAAPVLDWLAGVNFVDYFSAVDYWIAFGLLAFVGERMLVSGFNQNLEKIADDPARGLTLVILSLATSIYL